MLPLMVALLLTAPGKPHKVAVLDVEDTSGVEAARAKMITQVISGELPKLGRFQVISSSEISSMLGYQRQKQMLGCKEDQCLAELGGALGVDYLVAGQLAKFGSRYRLDLRLMDAAKSQVAASEGDFIAGNDDALADATVSMLHKLLADGHLTQSAALADSEPAGGLTQSTPSSPPRTAAWVTAGAAVVLAGAAVAMTLKTKSTFDSASKDPTVDDSSLKWSAPLADSLWAGAAICAGVSTYLFLRAPDSGAGGEVGLRGSF